MLGEYTVLPGVILTNPEKHGTTILANGTIDPLDFKAGLGQQAPPCGDWEQARCVAVRLHLQLATSLGEEHVGRLNSRVDGVEVRRVLNVREFGLGVVIGLVVDVRRLERFGVIVRRPNQQTTRALGERAVSRTDSRSASDVM